MAQRNNKTNMMSNLYDDGNEENSDDLGEFSAYNLDVKSLKEINGIYSHPQIRYLRVMHNYSMASMSGIEQLKYLVDVNLSSNSIVRLEGLNSLSFLKILNLSSNQLRELSGLSGLTSLEKLILAGNKIEDLSGLHDIAGNSYSLKVLDLRNNRIKDVKQVMFVQDLPRLLELTFEQGKSTNPICNESRGIYYQTLMQMRNFRDISRIDGQTPENIREGLQNVLTNPDFSPFQNISTLPFSRNINNKNNMSHPLKPVKEQLTRDQNAFYNSPNSSSKGNDKNSTENFQKQDVIIDALQLRQEREASNKNLIEMQTKLEVSEAFWKSKYEKIQGDYESAAEENRQKSQQIKVLTKEKTFLEEQFAELKNERIRMLNKTEKREEAVESLQQRITQLIHENGQTHRELAIRADQTEQQKNGIKELESELAEMKGRLRENERTLSEFHQKALEQANTTVMRNEEIRRKYEQVLDENKLIGQENSMLKSRVQELLEVCREWEHKYEKKISELGYKSEQQIRDIRAEVTAKEQSLEKQQRQWEQQKEEEFKSNADYMEQEFKKVLMENYDKFRRLQQAFEEKSKSEQEARHLMRIAVQKNTQQESVIEDLQTALQKVRKEVPEIISDKEQALKELDTRKLSYQRELAHLEDERDRLSSEKNNLERQFQDLAERHTADSLELDRARAKLKNFEGIEEELEKCLETIAAKNVMLEDKNDTIEELKGNSEQWKGREQQLSEDFAKLQKKYERQNQVIEELEGQLQQSNEELEQATEDATTANNELSKKKRLIDLFETELNEYKIKQERDIADKQDRIQELVALLEECKTSIRRKDDKINDLSRELDRRIEDAQVTVTQKEKIIRELTEKNEDMKKDIQLLCEENEKKKKTITQFAQQLHAAIQ